MNSSTELSSEEESSKETSSEFIDRYLEPNSTVEEFKAGYNLYELIDDNVFVGIVVTSIIAVIVGTAIDTYTPYSPSAWIVLAFVAIFFVVYILVYRAVVDTLHEHELTTKEITYHYLALYLEEYQEGNPEQARGAIKKMTDWLDGDKFGGLHTDQTEVIESLDEDTESESGEELKNILDSYHPSMLLIAEQILAIEDSNFDDILADLDQDDEQTTQTSYQFLRESLSDLRYAGPVKAILPFLGVALIGLLIFYQINQQLGMFAVIVLIPVVQYLVNRSDSD